MANKETIMGISNKNKYLITLVGMWCGRYFPWRSYWARENRVTHAHEISSPISLWLMW